MIYNEYEKVTFSDKELNRIQFHLDNYITSEIQFKNKKISELKDINFYLKKQTLENIVEIKYSEYQLENTKNKHNSIKIVFNTPIEIGTYVYNNVVLELSDYLPVCQLSCKRQYKKNNNPSCTDYETEYKSVYFTFSDNFGMHLNQLKDILIDADFKYYEKKKEELEKELEKTNAKLKEVTEKYNKLIKK